MRSQREFVDYLQDILDEIEKVEQFTEGMDFKGFSVDDKTVFAVIRGLEIIGEAARMVPKELRENYPDVPWSEMAGIRDKLIHGLWSQPRSSLEYGASGLACCEASHRSNFERSGHKKVASGKLIYANCLSPLHKSHFNQQQFDNCPSTLCLC